MSVAAGRMPDLQAAGQQVRDALGAVRDPDLCRAGTDLGVGEGVSIDGGRVHVHLRLPTYFGATDLAWLIVADARAAVGALPWVDSVEVCLRGRHELHGPQAVGQLGPPAGSGNDPERVRRACRAAFATRQYEIVRGFLDQGFRRSELCHLVVGDLPGTPETAVYLQRRAEAGLPVVGDAPLVVTEDGADVIDVEFDGYLAALRARAGAATPSAPRPAR